MSSKRPHELSARKRTALILEDPSAVAFPGPEHAMGFADPGRRRMAFPFPRHGRRRGSWRRRWVRPHAERFHASLTDGGDHPRRGVLFHL